MTPSDVFSLGWKPEHKNAENDPTQLFYYPYKKGDDRFIMSVSFVKNEPNHLVMINLVYHKERGIKSKWDNNNSETNFYGRLKTKDDLRMIMIFLSIIE